MGKKKGLFIILGIVLIGVVTLIFFATNGFGMHKAVDKEFDAYIYNNEHECVAKVKASLVGKHTPNNTLTDPSFTGVININGESQEIQVLDYCDPVMEVDESKYYVGNDVLGEGVRMADIKTSVAIARDFSSFYGYTKQLRDKYGDLAYFKSDPDLITIFDQK